MASEVGNSNLFSQVKRHRLLVCCCIFQQCNFTIASPKYILLAFPLNFTLSKLKYTYRYGDFPVPSILRHVMISSSFVVCVCVCVKYCLYFYCKTRRRKRKSTSTSATATTVATATTTCGMAGGKCQLLNIFVWLPLSISGYSFVLVAWIEFILLFYSFLWCHFVSEWTILSLYDMWIRIQSQGYNL